MDFALQKIDLIGSLHYQGPNNLPFQCYHSKLINIQFCKNAINIWWIFFNHIVMRENEKVVGDRPKPSNFHPKHCRNWNNMYPPSSSPERSENTNDAIESWVLEEGLVNINWYTCCRPILNWEYARIRIHHQTLSTNIHQLGLTNKLTTFTQTHHYPNNSSPKIFGTSYWSSKARVEGYSPKQWSNK